MVKKATPKAVVAKKQEEHHVTIDGVTYDLSQLSDEMKTQVIHLQIIDAELLRLNAQVAIHKTARVTYANALKSELSKLNA